MCLFEWDEDERRKEYYVRDEEDGQPESLQMVISVSIPVLFNKLMVRVMC